MATFQDRFSEASTSFVKWFLNQPGSSLSPKVHLADLRHQNEGRGLVALEDLDGDEVLFTVSRQSILSVENSFLRAKCPSIFDELDPWLSLVLVMIYEHLQGPESRWFPYLEMLLSTPLDTLIFWSEEELAELQGSLVLQKIGKTAADETFQRELVPKIQAHPELFPAIPNAHYQQDFTTMVVDLAHRMASIILAYAFDVGHTDGSSSSDEDEPEESLIEEDIAATMVPKALVPMADMLNADIGKINARLFHGESSLSMDTLRGVKQGEQIFNDYGALPRSDLLRRYGYTADNHARYDVVEIAADFVIQGLSKYKRMNAEAVQARIDYLELQGAMDDAFDLTHGESAESALPDELSVLTRTILLPPAEFADLCRRGSIPKPKLSLEVAKALGPILEQRIEDYATSIEDDRFLLKEMLVSKSGVTARRKKMAIEVRMGEKIILRRLLDMLNAVQTAGVEGAKRISSDDVKSRSGQKKARIN